MDDCRKYRDIFMEALYEELKPDLKQEFDAHLKDCSDCAAVFANLNSTLQVMDRRQREEPDPVFWSGYWDRLAEKMEKGEADPAATKGGTRRLFESLFIRPQWAMGTAAAVGLIVIGVFIGRTLFRPTGSPVIGTLVEESSRDTKMVALENRAGQYLRRSKVLLLGLINFDPQTDASPAIDIQQQQEISQALVHEAAVLKSELKDPARKQLLKLITDLEVILLQIANMEAEHDFSTIEMVKSGVDRRGVLLKINLEEMKQTEQDIETSEKPSQSQQISI